MPVDEVTAGVATYRVESGDWPPLAPVQFTFHSANADFRGHLTPEQADELADALHAHAAYARELILTGATR